MVIRMAVFDLDGTLLREDQTISQRTIAALLAARAKGIRLCFATGRGNSGKALVPMELFDGYALMNGALAYRGDRLIYERCVPPGATQAFLQAMDRAGLQAAAQRHGHHYANFDVKAKWPSITRCTQVEVATFAMEAEKLYCLAEGDKAKQAVLENVPKGLYAVIARDHLAMVMANDAKKSIAIAALADSFGISLADVVAFGDDRNDMDLLTSCGYGVAMGNALPSVKAIGDACCPSNEEDGIAIWLEENIRL